MSLASQNEGQVAQYAGLALHQKYATASLRWPTNSIVKAAKSQLRTAVLQARERQLWQKSDHRWQAQHVACCAQDIVHGLIAHVPPLCQWPFPQSAARSPGLLASRESQAFKTNSKHHLLPVSTSVTTSQCRGASLLRHLNFEPATQSCRLS